MGCWRYDRGSLDGRGRRWAGWGWFSHSLFCFVVVSGRLPWTQTKPTIG